MVLVKIWPFFQPSFYSLLVRKMLFTIFQNVKTPFQATKTRSSKSRKIDIFPNRFIHGFAPNVAIFPTFFYRQYWLGKCCLRYSRTKKRLSRLQKQEVQKSRRIDIFPKGLIHGFAPNVAIFPTFFQALIVEKMSFTIFQNDKAPFQAIKKKEVHNVKKLTFSKGVNPWFWSNYGHFSNLFFQAIQVRKCLLRYFRSKKRLSRLCKQVVQKVEKLKFFQTS